MTNPHHEIKAEVYWNLHKKCWSVRHKGRVVCHVGYAVMKDVTWVVQPAGRERVLREKKKNVHAFARGTLVLDEKPKENSWVYTTYNPYKKDTFYQILGIRHYPVKFSPWATFGISFSPKLNRSVPEVWSSAQR